MSNTKTFERHGDKLTAAYFPTLVNQIEFEIEDFRADRVLTYWLSIDETKELIEHLTQIIEQNSNLK